MTVVVRKAAWIPSITTLTWLQSSIPEHALYPKKQWLDILRQVAATKHGLFDPKPSCEPQERYR